MFPSEILEILRLETFGLNIIDVVIIIVLVFYALEGFASGFVSSLFDFLSFVLSFVLGLRFYSVFGSLIVAWFGVPLGFSNAIGFFLVALISELVFNVLLRKGFLYIKKKRAEDFAKPLFKKANSYLGFLPSLLSASLLLSFIFTLIISLPISPALKSLVAESRLGSFFVLQTQGFEKNLNSVFGGAVNDTLNFLTVKPESNELVDLNFEAKNLTIDPKSEAEMLALVNRERTSRGLPALEFDQALTNVARKHSKDMFERGYFSHYTPEGLSPFDRMAQDNITYRYAGENLAFAPSVELAMEGLMKSPGHRENILSPNFGKAGIGVIDGGIYGKMFSQEFTD